MEQYYDVAVIGGGAAGGQRQQHGQNKSDTHQHRQFLFHIHFSFSGYLQIHSTIIPVENQSTDT